MKMSTSVITGLTVGTVLGAGVAHSASQMQPIHAEELAVASIGTAVVGGFASAALLEYPGIRPAAGVAIASGLLALGGVVALNNRHS